MRAYNALVLSVLLYNSATWGVSQSVVRKLEVFHRGHLRRVLGVRWPYKISNEDLYRRCNAEPLGSIIKRLRWKMFGHVLRLSQDTPAQLAMDFYCTSAASMQRGRAKTTLPVLLLNEYHAYKQQLKKSSYRQTPTTALKELRRQAADRDNWAQVVKEVCQLASEEEAV